MDQTNSCSYCEKRFAHKRTLNAHLRNVHDVDPGTFTNRKICCTKCNEKFFRREDLREHYSEKHEIKIEVEEKTFQTLEDFKVWKQNMEKLTKSSYVKKNNYKTSSGDITSYYFCHRSGTYVPEGKGERKMKSVGTQKIGTICPSSLKVITSPKSSNVEVVFWKTHLSHECDLRHLHFSETEKTEIADKIRAGVNFDRILKDIRDTLTTSEDLHRIHLIQRKDLHNINAQFGFSSDEKLHESDVVSINLFVQRMETFGEDSPVIFFKPQGRENNGLQKKDFMIVIMTKFQKVMCKKFSKEKICIDSTHGTNEYDYKLTTLLTVDEYLGGCPIAFCISNRTDKPSMCIFFESVKKQIGLIETSVFMSDDDPAYYNAWEVVMAPVDNHLLCAWHIDRNWCKNLPRISNKVKRALVYQTLRVLLMEIECEKFVIMLKNFVKQIIEDPETKDFGNYFVKEYYPRTKMWAYCFRKYVGINTNMYLEAMHKRIKYHYLDGKKARRVDKAVNVLLLFSRDLMFKRLNNIIMCVPSGRLKKISESHRRSKDISETVKIDENYWQVKSSSQEGHYDVRRREEPCPEDCKVKCSECNICIHSFSCTCIDNIIRYNICKHIHACARKTSPAMPQNSGIEVDEVQEIIQSNINYSHQLVQPAPLETLHQKESMIRNYLFDKDYSDECKKHIEDTFDNLLMYMKENGKPKCDFKIVDKNPKKRKIEKQARFYSTKKPRKNKGVILKTPSFSERKSCAEALLSENGECLLVNDTTDHTYS